MGAAGGVAGDDHGVADVVVRAAETEVGGAQVGQDVVVAGGGVVVAAAGPGGGSPDQAAVFVGQGEEVQAMAAVLAGEFRRSALPVRRWVRMRVPSIRTTSPPC